MFNVCNYSLQVNDLQTFCTWKSDVIQTLTQLFVSPQYYAFISDRFHSVLEQTTFNSLNAKVAIIQKPVILRKSINWFLYDSNFRVKRVNGNTISIHASRPASMNRFLDQKNFHIIFEIKRNYPFLKRNGMGNITIRSEAFQLLSNTIIMLNN